jgi:ATP-dependent Zn protease
MGPGLRYDGQGLGRASKTLVGSEWSNGSYSGLITSMKGSGYNMKMYEEEIEDIADDRIINMVKACYKNEKKVLRFRKVDMNRFKTQGMTYETIVNGTAIDIKEGGYDD